MSENHARSYAETTPKLAELGREVLFGDVWERGELSKRDRSLVTVAALVTGNYPMQMPFHMERALEKEVVTHLAFYAGWPCAVTAADILGQVLHARADRGGDSS
jgi:4-carboxymuconolactone decarboxylase